MVNQSLPRADIYTRVTAKIISDLERGVRPWQKPWASPIEGRMPLLPLRSSGVPYRGVNILLLWGAAQDAGYTRNIWMTYKQATTMGAQVRKGEHGSLVVYADRFTKTETDANGTESEREIAFMKGYTVFNVQQIDGLPAHLCEPSCPLGDAEHVENMIEEAAEFFDQTGAIFQHGGNRAFYAPSKDVIQLPPAQAFRDAESYAATKAHELIHWTSHPSRLARELGKRFGDRSYAVEELIAEMGAAFLCADLAITPDIRDDHAAYLAHWLGVLKADSRAIFTAASQAQRAADYLHSITTPPKAAA